MDNQQHWGIWLMPTVRVRGGQGRPEKNGYCPEYLADLHSCVVDKKDQLRMESSCERNFFFIKKKARLQTQLDLREGNKLGHGFSRSGGGRHSYQENLWFRINTSHLTLNSRDCLFRRPAWSFPCISHLRAHLRGLVPQGSVVARVRTFVVLGIQG